MFKKLYEDSILEFDILNKMVNDTETDTIYQLPKCSDEDIHYLTSICINSDEINRLVNLTGNDYYITMYGSIADNLAKDEPNKGLRCQSI